mmetsp:Transcript_111836/g.241147  ORF Transcript_111836/g.241147 Transcript_111836/m.241147 type:complete len:118 (+) Transcript_111836:533-886(+)
MHINELQPCLGNAEGEQCAKFAKEVKYIQSYRDFLTQAPTASATFVVFHNLVSASVQNVKYLMGGRPHFYCASDVLRDMPREFVSDTPGAAVGPQGAMMGLPGLSAEDSLVSCPSYR